jgi:hypothetical protein
MVFCLALSVPVLAATAGQVAARESASRAHLGGYATAQYVDPEHDGGFFAASFNPIFLYNYRDLVLGEGELELEVEDNGETNVVLEFATIDLLLNDSMVLMAGKFLSPLGQFRQNLHPSWINKLPSAPVGFGEDGAAPDAEIGAQLRGGIELGGGRLGYSAYIGNGPKLAVEEGEIEGIDSEGYASNDDDENVVGGRLSFVPLPKLEFGISGATGKVAITEIDGIEVPDDPSRNYNVFGADASYRLGSLDLRGEYIQQKVSNESDSLVPEGGKWDTWYAQAAYKFGRAKWEGVVRYGDFNSPHPEQSQEQFAIGLNYLMAPQAIVKVGYEFNDGLAGEATDADRLILQVAYGF